jgi:hypothetical protein
MTRIDLGYGLKGLLWKKKPVSTETGFFNF